MNIKHVLYYLCILLLVSCKPNGKSQLVETHRPNPFNENLIEQQVTGTPIYISLPTGYRIKESRGIDFSVYYFKIADTTNKNAFQGGFYLGNAPALFEARDSTWKTHTLTSAILGYPNQWTVYQLNHQYTIQIITGTNSKQGWDKLIHAFGSCKSKADLDKLLYIYSTLKFK